MNKSALKNLLHSIRNCTICEKHLPFGPRPVLNCTSKSKIAIIGQAPGVRVHKSGIPWDDPSGKNLRDWLGVSDEAFYDPDIFAIVPMGFCYPGTGKSGDLAPRKECAKEWHEELFQHMPNLELTLLIGKYAQDYYLNTKQSLTQNVKQFRDFLPEYFVLPHPSPRNNIWQKKNPWFKAEVLPELKQRLSLEL